MVYVHTVTHSLNLVTRSMFNKVYSLNTVITESCILIYIT